MQLCVRAREGGGSRCAIDISQNFLAIFTPHTRSRGYALYTPIREFPLQRLCLRLSLMTYDELASRIGQTMGFEGNEE